MKYGILLVFLALCVAVFLSAAARAAGRPMPSLGAAGEGAIVVDPRLGQDDDTGPTTP